MSSFFTMMSCTVLSVRWKKLSEKITSASSKSKATNGAKQSLEMCRIKASFVSFASVDITGFLRFKYLYGTSVSTSFNTFWSFVCITASKNTSSFWSSQEQISTTAVSIAEKAGEFPLVSYVSSTFPDRSRMDRVREYSVVSKDSLEKYTWHLWSSSVILTACGA